MADRSRFPTPPEVSAYFRDKNLKPGFSWQDVWNQEHAYNFTVAKAVDAELLATFKESLQRALDNGQSFETWRDGLWPELERLGWWGKRMVADPTGKAPDKAVDFSSPRRLQTIFWSNVRSARAAGQWERAQRSKRALPYFLYVQTTSKEPRQEHLAWVGIILPVDHPFWDTHFPPNGWGCKCSVRQITQREADKLLQEPGYTDDPGDFERTTTYINKRTGQVTQEPVGIDPGWGTNPGKSRAETLVESMTAKLEAVGPDLARTVVGEWTASPAPKILIGLDPKLRLPVAVAPDLAERLDAKSPIIAVGNDTMRRKVDKHAPVDPKSFAYIQEIVDKGERIDEGRGDQFLTIVGEAASRWWKLVLAVSANGYLRVQTFMGTNIREVERLRRKDRSGK